MRAKVYSYSPLFKCLTFTLAVLLTVIAASLIANPGLTIHSFKSHAHSKLKLQRRTSPPSHAMISTDPIRFNMEANKRHVRVGEEIELIITAELLNISSKSLFFLDGSSTFSLKLLSPAGFVRSDSDENTLFEGELFPNKTTATYRVKGRFSSTTGNLCFRLLRSEHNPTYLSRYVEKATLCFNYRTTESLSITSKQTERTSMYVLLDETSTANTRLAIPLNNITCSEPVISVVSPSNNTNLTTTSFPFYFDIQTLACAPQNVSQVQYNVIDPNGVYHYFCYVDTPSTNPDYPYALTASRWQSDGQYTINQPGVYTIIPRLFVQGGGYLDATPIQVTISQSNSPTGGGNCAFAEGQHLLSWYGEEIYAHYHNGVLFAAYQDGSNFKSQSWVNSTSAYPSQVACFAQNDPRLTSPTGGGDCAFAEGQYLLSWYGEEIYAHYYNGVLFAAYQNSLQGFKPKSWLSAAGFNPDQISCFVQNDPRVVEGWADINSLTSSIHDTGNQYAIDQSNIIVNEANQASNSVFLDSIADFLRELAKLLDGGQTYAYRGVIQFQWGNNTRSFNWAQNDTVTVAKGIACLNQAFAQLTAKQQRAFQCTYDRARNIIQNAPYNNPKGLPVDGRSNNFVRLCCPSCLKDLDNRADARCDIQINKGIPFTKP